MTDLSRDPNLREDLIEDIQSTNDGAGHEGDADILKIALRLKNEERVRNILEEKERRLIEAQRHAARLEEERRLNVKPNPEDVPETEDDTAADLFLHPDSTQDQIAAVVKRRASLLGDLDARHKASFVHKEMKRELAFRHSVAVEKDADKKRELIEQHKRTLEELKQRTSSLPGHAQQLQDVWEKEDGMADKFNPKVFFALHDINSDGLWDHKELEALFYRSATRLHTVNGETDMDAVRQEMIEMRRAVLREVDTNQDSLVSRREFITFSQEPEFRKDGKWKTVFPDFQGNELKEFAQQLKKAKQEHKAKLRRLRNATADGAEEKEEQGKSDSSDEGDGSNGDRPIKSRFV